ncbi:MAG: 3-phosphoserine/phosphohydroxythreonine transaminase [Candidatus Parabeggiatoa sp. nov. 3]|nr:MAG: 3-phosphoserine/phosphohydroxythreonine transaminase [Gammaproteobacteria bacterium]RKZ63645.1 MAG: 3-phosphoserine/phosphohydroxythreonine transaminase [Gammaproteobacteria bacterium]RKZ79556.1 MAG: 3-phosphoserine/phosphohydroxythreonine transaminase [Gammaproteobacteria bacterium]
MSRAFNFSAGPAMLPEPVLEQAQAEILDWQGSGMSIMEMSHRGKEFMSIAEQSVADLRALLNIPENYKVLFLQGGASSQFAMVPLNLLRGSNESDYFNTGIWSKKAIAEAKKFCQVNVIVDSQANNFTTISEPNTWQLNPNAAYVHYTPNETINGLEFQSIPDVGDKPLIADMSSTILSRPIDVSQYGLIYAGAQKNIGPAGLTIVIIREDLIDSTLPNTPSMFNYKNHLDAGSMYNTPPTYAWYLAGLVFKWIKGMGGLEEMGKRNQRKAANLYAAIDSSAFYNNPVDPSYRSWMNVPFTLNNPDLNPSFLAEAKEACLVTLAGHRSVGGMRASIYNAMPEEGVQALIDFMSDFEKRKG